MISLNYDLEERTRKFGRRVRAFVSKLPRTAANTEDGRQLIRSSGSIGANYIEANESLSKKDFGMRLKICRKESKESRHWLALIIPPQHLSEEHALLQQEAKELVLIFASILRKAGFIN